MVFERVKGQGENAQDKWRRVSPNAADADNDKVDSHARQAGRHARDSFVESTAKTGLDKPALTST